MVVTGKIKNNSGGERWGTDIFLVFFPEEDEQELTSSSSSSSSSSSPFKFPTINSLLKRTNSTHILTRTQSTISICALLIFLTFLFFTLSTFEPNNNFTSTRRFPNSPTSYTPALQRLGTLYTRGTTAMDNLILCHVTESVTTKQLKLFLRAFHRSGLPSNSDLLFIFDSVSTPESFNNVILEENEFFLKIIGRNLAELCNGGVVLDFPASFDLTQFVKSGKKVVEKGEPIWGWKIKSKNSSLLHCGDETESTRIRYGSVVGFGVGELDPENSLSGFMDHIPMSLRRWAVYPMILGRVRRNFKHVMLVDVKKVLLLGDPLGRVKNKSPDSVFLSSTPPPPGGAIKHGRKSSENTHQNTINPAVIMGGVRGIRRLSAAMLTAVVQAAINQQHNKRKNSVMESGLISRLAANEFTLKSIRVSMLAESMPAASSVSESTIANQTMVWVEHSDYNEIESVIMKHICSFPIDSAVYRDC